MKMATVEDTLSSPLLRSEHRMTDATEFPNEQAAQLKILVPEEWKVASSTCHLQYDASQQLIKIISDDFAGQVLDVIDPDDMIGASLSLEMGSNYSDTTPSPDQIPGRASNEPSTNALVDRQGSAILNMYCYPRVDPSQKSWMNWMGVTSYRPRRNPQYTRTSKHQKVPRVKQTRSFRLAPSEDFQAANQVLSALRHLATPHTLPRNDGTPLKYLILINPRSGPKRNGLEVCRKTVQPMLEQAGIDVHLCVTEYANHGKDRMTPQANSEEDITKYDGLILMGGDGIIHEALNGLMERSDFKTSIAPKLAVGVVGVGSCNGYSTSVTHASMEVYGPLTETFLIAKGQTELADLSIYETSNTNRKYTSFLAFTYAMISDIDIESEVIHWVGEPRNDIWGALMVLLKRKYPAKVSYLPADKVANTSQPVAMPALTESLGGDWVTVDDDIILLWSSQTTHAAMHTHQSPNSKLNDGIFKLLLVRGKVSRLRMAMILLGLESGSHLGQPKVEEVDCCAIRVEPREGARIGKNVIDGELVEAGPIQGHVVPSAIKVFYRPHIAQPESTGALS